MRVALVPWMVLCFGSACWVEKIDAILADLSSPTSTGEPSSSGTGGVQDTSGSDAGSSGASDGASGGIGTGTDGGSTAAADGSSGPATTDAPAEAVCGNGTVEAAADPAEECDDGNVVAGDGCDETCAREIRVFVSSKWFMAGELGSLYKADAQCLGMAKEAGLWEVGKNRFQAWLSDSETDARDWLSPGRGRLVFVNGLVFAQSFDALLAGALERPLEVTELSTTLHGKVWTGTGPDGTAVPDSGHCEDWASTSVLETAYYGYSGEISAEWTLAETFDNPLDCAAPLHIYCFEEFL